MKRFASLLAGIALLLVIPAPSAAQSLTCGLTAGLNLSKLILSGDYKDMA